MKTTRRYGDVTLKIEGNTGTITLKAASAREALKRARQIFPHVRNVGVAGTAERFVVDFKVGFNHNRRLLKRARRLSGVDVTQENYDGLVLGDRYMILLQAQLARKSTFLGDPIFLRDAVRRLRDEIRGGRGSGADELMEYDIAVHNLLDSGS
jgi:hypothetical protein